jgi:hypothetical protein
MEPIQVSNSKPNYLVFEASLLEQYDEIPL